MKDRENQIIAACAFAFLLILMAAWRYHAPKQGKPCHNPRMVDQYTDATRGSVETMYKCDDGSYLFTELPARSEGAF